MTALHVYGGLVALFWVAAWLRAWRTDREGRWRLGPGAPADAGDGRPLPPLQVVIPARDEAANIGPCVAAIRASDHPSLRVRVFDDGSTDGTAALAVGAEVVAGGGGPLPEGWKGKPWALQRATRDLDAEWLCFIDADVRVAPEALARVHAYALREGADFVSGFGRLEMVTFWEKVIQPSVGGLIIAGNDLDRVNDPRRPEDLIANGQLILVRRAAYEAVGGHGAVSSDILDDVGLARAFHASGAKVRVLFMRDLFRCRMYTGFRELWDGWTKNLYAGMHHRRGLVAGLVAFLLFEMVAPYLLLPVGLLLPSPAMVAWGVALVGLIHAVRFWMDGVFGQDRRFGLLQPLGAVMLIGLLLASARRSHAGTVAWKGRTYAVRREDDTLSKLNPPSASG